MVWLAGAREFATGTLIWLTWVQPAGVALGEIRDTGDIENVELAAGVEYAKLGLAGCAAVLVDTFDESRGSLVN
jgi:hypothetical protein